LVLPLGLDTFGVALALGIAGLPGKHRLRVSLLFAGFEALMPLIGLALGAPLGEALGRTADYIRLGSSPDSACTSSSRTMTRGTSYSLSPAGDCSEPWRSV
jgi:hypothetical protein